MKFHVSIHGYLSYIGYFVYFKKFYCKTFKRKWLNKCILLIFLTITDI